MTDEQRLREAVEGHVAEHRQANGPGAMAISDADRLARANILAAIVDGRFHEVDIEDAYRVVEKLRSEGQELLALSVFTLAKFCRTLLHASKGTN